MRVTIEISDVLQAKLAQAKDTILRRALEHAAKQLRHDAIRQWNEMCRRAAERNDANAP